MVLCWYSTKYGTKVHEMQRRFTVNGAFIPQDAAGNDMCILFMKYGRCRFKTKCRKSHWVPPLPDEPYIVEDKPPLPNDDQISKERNNTLENVRDSQSSDSQNLSEPLENASPHFQSPKSTSGENTDSKTACVSNLNCMLPRRFKHIFHDNCDTNDRFAENSGVKRLFNEAGSYFDNGTKKLHLSQPPRNKIEKHRLKVLRRIHWRNTQTLKEKLSQFPPSYSLIFDRSKIDFTRLRPYVYVLVHECMCVEGEKKPKPSSFEYLIADTLLAYLSDKCITPQEAEAKLQHWGARAVRARQCIDHLWHVLAISSKSSHGCANEIIRIEEDIVKGTRTSLDYACACAFALKRVKLKATITERSHVTRNVSTSLRQGLEAKRLNKIKQATKNAEKVSSRANERVEDSRDTLDHCFGKTEHAVINVEDIQECTNEETQHAQGKITHEKSHEDIAQKQSEKHGDGLKHLLFKDIWKKRQRSRQFKNMPFDERRKFKTRCVELLSAS